MSPSVEDLPEIWPQTEQDAHVSGGKSRRESPPLGGRNWPRYDSRTVMVVVVCLLPQILGSLRLENAPRRAAKTSAVPGGHMWAAFGIIIAQMRPGFRFESGRSRAAIPRTRGLRGNVAEFNNEKRVVQVLPCQIHNLLAIS